MKKLLSVLAVPALCLTFVGSASAQISNTGPGSTNSVNTNTTTNTSVVCVNSANVNSSNNQSSTTGGATTNNNTTGGGAQTGNSSNSNNSSVAVNGGCGAGTVPVPAGSAEAIAAGGGYAPAGRGAVDAQGRLLPNTGVDSTVRGVAIAVASLTAAAGAVVAGTSIYRRRALG